jgi:radical SAM protein with 4Fe4S-binding SPASM domain
MPSTTKTAAEFPPEDLDEAETPSRSEMSVQAPTEPGARTHPLQVTWEMTSACHWRASSSRTSARAARERERKQVSTAEAFHLIDEVARLHVPLLALTGGDPLLRPDLLPVIEFASKRAVRTSLTLLPTPILEPAVIDELKASGLMRVAFWLHGSTPGLNDGYWSVPGSHRRTVEHISHCHEVELPVQINTILARRNFHDIEPMIELLTRLDITWWNVFFYVPADHEHTEEMLTAEENEEAFAKLYAASRRVHFQIKTTEGQHYQRYVVQQRVRESRGKMNADDVIAAAPKGVNDSNGFVFVNHQGDVYPSRYLPLAAGNLTNQSLSEVYCDSPLFASLRDSSKLKGKCGRCAVRSICGGSRARAYAITGDLFAAEPCCAYEP